MHSWQAAHAQILVPTLAKIERMLAASTNITEFFYQHSNPHSFGESLGGRALRADWHTW